MEQFILDLGNSTIVFIFLALIVMSMLAIGDIFFKSTWRYD